MALNETPNRLESAFIQRDLTNTFYEQINISGSDLIIYHSSSGILTADKISVWATKYGIGSGGSGGSGVTPGGSYNISTSYASASISSSYAFTASYALNGGDSGINPGGSYNISSSWASSSIWSLVSTQSLFSTQSLYSTQSLSSSWASSSLTSSYIGSGTNNYLPKWNNNTLTSTSNIYDNGTRVGIATSSPQETLHVQGNISASSITASNVLTISPIAPSDPITGKMWYDTSDNSQATPSSSYSATASILVGSLVLPIKTVTSDYTVNNNDYTLIASGSSPIVFTLPLTNISHGRILNFKNRTANPIYLYPTGSMIDGEASLTSSFINTNIQLQCSSSEWFVL